jgi:hypothetical protein
MFEFSDNGLDRLADWGVELDSCDLGRDADDDDGEDVTEDEADGD